jgi:signal transduction histidine kinase
MAELTHPAGDARLVRSRSRRARPPPRNIALAVAAVSVAILAVASDGHPSTAALYAIGVALPLGVGLGRLASHPEDRFARVLLGAGALWALTALAQADDSVLYSTGRVAAWIVEPVLVYLILAFPTGRLTTTTERRLTAATVGLAAVLYLPTAVLDQFPEPSPWGACGTDCPSNAFVVGDGASAVVDVVTPLREVLVVVLWAAVAALLVRRWRNAGPLMRRAIVPVALIAVCRGFVMAFYLISRTGWDTSQAADALGTAYLLSLPAVTIAFAAGLVIQRLFVADALQDLTQGLRPHANAADVQGAMERALHDPSLHIVYWRDGPPGRWVDATGWPAGLPDEDGRAVTEVATADGRRAAAIVHDAELARDPGLIEAATAYALTTIENDRLARELQASLDELHHSRARIVAAADAERRRIERDLHDGAQQQLVALRIKVGLLAEELAEDSAGPAARLTRFGSDIETTIDEIRSFGRAVYPPLLAEKGLAEALRAAARRAPIPATIVARNVRRHPLEVESTVYFACVEALQNASKHARATSASISLSDNHRLRFEVHDNGQGFDAADVAWGVGLTNLRDRLAAVGGTFEVESAPGHGTSVIGTIPNR